MTFRHLALVVVLTLGVIGQTPFARAETAPRVVVSLAPLHALAAAVMAGVATPHLLVPVTASPHDWSLRPSQAAALASADLVIWISPQLESFLVRPLDSLPDSAQQLTLSDVENLTRYPYRATGISVEDDHQHDHVEDEHQHDHADGLDPHLWLDPHNALIMATAMAEALTARDPIHGATYAANLAQLRERLTELDDDLRQYLAPFTGRPFLVTHDAFQYLEKRYHLKVSGALVASPERTPGARRLAEISDAVTAQGITCLMAEPQFPRALAQRLAEATGTHLGLIDPLGVGLTPGPQFYEQLLRRMAKQITDCLTHPPSQQG